MTDIVTGPAGLVRRIESIADDGGYDDACRRLLHLLRTNIGMDVAWTSEFVGTRQVFRFVDAGPGQDAPTVGSGTPLNDAYCSRVLNGTMPPLIPNVRDEPAAVWLDVTLALHIGSYLGVPLHGPDGVPNGMLCAISSRPVQHLDDRALATARLVAQVIDDLHHRALGEREAQARRERVRADVEAACAGRGRWAVLQPIVDLRTGEAVAAEGLARFDDGGRTPASWFAAAHSVGMGRQLEVAAARAVLDWYAAHPGPPTIAVNLSPDVAVDSLAEALAGVDPARVVLELTEYAPVADYDALAAALRPYRARGLRVAVDDAGAGYASLSHVLRLQPDVVKIDMSLVHEVDRDPVRQALVGALVRFCEVAGAEVVAEGVETEAELGTLVSLGVLLAQGFLFGRPCPRPAWAGLPHAPGVAPATA